jgi:hypothetical protein
MFGFILIFFITINHIRSTSIQIVNDCELLIAGGTTAAFGAILSASKFLQTRVCLLEPTDWVGGQLTAELLSAPDFAGYTLRDNASNFTLDVGAINRDPINRNPLFTQMLNVFGDTGHCTVSPWCTVPQLFHEQVVLPLVKNTRIFYNTVIKRVTKDASGRRIIQLDAIQRTPRQTEERCRFLSEELPDWYSPDDSSWFTKTQLSFTNFSFIMEGTSWGEILVLSNASYLQGITEQFDGDISGKGNATCGQAITFDYLEQLHETPVDEPPNPLPKAIRGGNYSFGESTWERIWIFRRVNTSVSDTKTVAVNDITIQNWSQGDDYSGIFFYLSPSETEHQRDTNQWQGGVNLEAIQNAERQSYGAHYWFRENAPPKWTNRTTLVRSPSATGTCHHLAKLPYMRESHRSIGYQNFLMNVTTISGPASNLHGYIFDDRLCLGAYDIDIHFMNVSCNYPPHLLEYYPVLPYYIPLRAMTNRDIDNLIPIGKTMAQSFLVNSAVRLHPVEFSIGQAAGVVGSYAVHNKLPNVAEMLKEEHLRRVQSIVKEFTPTSWTIDGKRYPDD